MTWLLRPSDGGVRLQWIGCFSTTSPDLGRRRTPACQARAALEKEMTDESEYSVFSLTARPSPQRFLRAVGKLLRAGSASFYSSEFAQGPSRLKEQQRIKGTDRLFRRSCPPCGILCPAFPPPTPKVDTLTSEPSNNFPEIRG